MTREEAKTAWYTKVLNDEEVNELLADETGFGVVIGFFLGCGFSIDEAYELTKEVEH